MLTSARAPARFAAERATKNNDWKEVELEETTMSSVLVCNGRGGAEKFDDEKYEAVQAWQGDGGVHMRGLQRAEEEVTDRKERGWRAREERGRTTGRMGPQQPPKWVYSSGPRKQMGGERDRSFAEGIGRRQAGGRRRAGVGGLETPVARRAGMVGA